MNNDDLLEVRRSSWHMRRQACLPGSGVEEGDRIIVSPIRNPVAGMALSAIEETADPVQLSGG